MGGTVCDVVIGPDFRKMKTSDNTNFKKHMKTQILTFILFVASFTLAFAQEETTPKKDFILYSFIVNNIPDGSWSVGTGGI